MSFIYSIVDAGSNATYQYMDDIKKNWNGSQQDTLTSIRDLYTLSERQDQVKLLLKTQPTFIPIVYNETREAQVVCRYWTWDTFCNGNPFQVNDHTIHKSTNMEDIYDMYKDIDGYLYIYWRIVS